MSDPVIHVKTKLMPHKCMYLGNGGCLLNIPFRYLTSKGWSDSFANILMITVLAKALRAALKPLHKPSLYIPCKNLSTLSILVIGILIPR